MVNAKIGNYLKIQKQTAMRYFNLGLPITICPCKLDPISRWGVATTIDKHKGDFDRLITNFEYYNCNNETGKYTAYYVQNITGMHLSFVDNSNPSIIYGDFNKCINELNNWLKQYHIVNITINKGYLYVKLQSNQPNYSFI